MSGQSIMHGSLPVHRPVWDGITLCCKDMDIVWEEIGCANPRCNLKSEIPQQGWHSLSPRLTSVVLWLLPRPGCRAKAMPPWKLHTLLYIALGPTEDLFWVSKGSVGFSCFILPITSTDVLSCWSWKQTFKMLREDSFKSSSDWIGRHTTHTQCPAREWGGGEMFLLCFLVPGRSGGSWNCSFCGWEASPDPCTSWVGTDDCLNIPELLQKWWNNN